MWVQNTGGMILTDDNRSTRRKNCHSATLFTINPTWTDVGSFRASKVRGRRLTSWALIRPFVYNCPYAHREGVCRNVGTAPSILNLVSGWKQLVISTTLPYYWVKKTPPNRYAVNKGLSGPHSQSESSEGKICCHCLYVSLFRSVACSLQWLLQHSHSC